MKVAIHHKGKVGFVKYNKGSQEIMVTHPDEKVRDTVRNYLKSDRQFTVSGHTSGDEVGNRQLIIAKPTDNTSTMLMGLCEMFHHTGVHVNWGHEDNSLEDATETKNTEDPNAEADKPIAKSVFGDGDYEIIN